VIRPFPRLLPNAASLVLASVVSLVAVTSTRDAAADVSSWAYAGGGVSAAGTSGLRPNAGLLQLEAGLGTEANAPLVAGLLLRTLTNFEHGTDCALLLRAANASFVTGTFGVALDVGAYQRWWGPAHGPGGMATLNVGLPWGVNASISGGLGSGGLAKDGEHLLAFSLGIDWARFTVHRTSGENWWHNYQLPLEPKDETGFTTAQVPRRGFL
jgi:hypothetical protein